MQWTPEQYRAAYHFNRFTAGWRQLLVFYVAMTLAGYAQVIHSFIFYAAWGALVLMYWEPYLSPPFPWTSDSRIKDGFDALLSLQLTGGSVDPEELVAIKQYVLGIQRGLNETQLRVYKVLFGAIIVPYALLMVGVVKQATLPHYSQERQAVYASGLLLALMTVYAASVGVCLWIFHCVQRQESEESRAQEVDWQPHDMMFFMCKILGETLNTVVQTLVAGSFTGYMPWPIFWLCICITGLSYTATNLLYDFDDNPPITDSPDKGCLLIRSLKPSPQQQPHLAGFAPTGFDPTASAAAYKPRQCDVIMPVHDSAELPSALSAPAHLTHTWPGGSGGLGCEEGDATYVLPPLQIIDDTDPTPDCGSAAAAAGQPYGHSPAAAAAAAAAATAGRKPGQTWRTRLQSMKQSKGPKKPPSPPFLKYKWPKGARGRSIIGLLLAVSVPSLFLLVLVGRGIATGSVELFLDDPKHECRAAGEACLDRYVQLLVIMCCLGCLISYYAFTIGFLGAGPVTWLYQILKGKKRPQAQQ